MNIRIDLKNVALNQVFVITEFAVSNDTENATHTIASSSRGPFADSSTVKVRKKAQKAQ